jgi:hypothetical protein
MLKWINFYPPVGVIEAIVQRSFEEEATLSVSSPTDQVT